MKTIVPGMFQGNVLASSANIIENGRWLSYESSESWILTK